MARRAQMTAPAGTPLTRNPGTSKLGISWIALCLALALHVTDEASTDFLSVYNPTVSALRAKFGFWPMPTFEFREWLTGLIVAVARPIGVVSARIQGSALDAAGLLRLCRHHVVEWVRSHGRNDFGSHGEFSSFSAADAGLLLISGIASNLGVRPAPVEAHRCGPPIPVNEGRLSG